MGNTISSIKRDLQWQQLPLVTCQKLDPTLFPFFISLSLTLTLMKTFDAGFDLNILLNASDNDTNYD